MGSVLRVLRVEKGEGRLTALVAGLMFVAMAGLTIGESGIEGLFFHRVGPQALPMMYILQGASAMVAMLVLTGGLGVLGPRRAYLAAPAALGGVILAERAVLFANPRWIYPVLWVTVAIAVLVQGIFLWGTADTVVDIRQAKRLFPLFGAGGILGSVVGGVLTRPLASTIGAENLLLVWAGGCGVAYLLCRLVLGQPSRVRRRPLRARAAALSGVVQVLGLVRRSSLLTWITVAAVLFSLLFYTLYLPYARAASEQFPNADDLAGFFGLFWAAGTSAAFLVSMVVANRLLMWFGGAAMVVVLALMYATAFGVLLAEPGFVALVALKFAIGIWLQGVASPAWEALLNVFPESRRDQVRAFLNGGPLQLGTVIAGGVALVGQQTLSLRQFAVVGLVVAVLTVITTVGIRRSYLGALVDALRAGRPQVFERAPVREFSVGFAVDADAVRALYGSAQSPDVRERRLAFQLFAGLPVAARPVEFPDGVHDRDPVVRMAAIQALDLSTRWPPDALGSMIDDPDPAVAAAAAVRMIGVAGDARARSRLHALLTHADDSVRRAAVEQLPRAPVDSAAVLARELLADPDAQVRAAALEHAAAATLHRARDVALAGLQDPDPMVRIAAGRALGRVGGRGLEHALDAYGSPQTADAAIEAVRRMHPHGGDERVREFVRAAAERATRRHQLAAVIPAAGDAAELLRDAVLDCGRQVARSGLWAATMLGARRAEMEIAIENLDGAPGQLANALETLETAGDAGLLRPLLALWEPPPRPVGEDGWLSRALDDEDELIRRCAEFVRAQREGVAMPRGVTALSRIERLLFLRKAPLFADLAPADLDRIAKLAEERGFADGEVIATEGEIGEELHVVVEGTIRVIRGGVGSGRELACRTVGDAVGEMSLITHEPRIASLVAAGAVRTIRLGRREFESMVRERPGVALALMRVLAHRLAESGGGAEAGAS